jgi:hypothetical protein
MMSIAHWPLHLYFAIKWSLSSIWAFLTAVILKFNREITVLIPNQCLRNNIGTCLLPSGYNKYLPFKYLP